MESVINRVVRAIISSNNKPLKIGGGKVIIEDRGGKVIIEDRGVR